LEGQAKPPRSSLGAFFAHPATLILIGGAITAVLSGLLVPYITRSWQNHDRELERRNAIFREELGVKSQVVSLAYGATVRFLDASQLHPYDKARQSDYDRAYSSWSTLER
jgi:hypothetical protein